MNSHTPGPDRHHAQRLRNTPYPPTQPAPGNTLRGQHMFQSDNFTLSHPSQSTQPLFQPPPYPMTMSYDSHDPDGGPSSSEPDDQVPPLTDSGALPFYPYSRPGVHRMNNAATITRLAAELGLDHVRCQALQVFNVLDPPDQRVYLCGRLLKHEQDVSAVNEIVTTMSLRLDNLEPLVKSNWHLTQAQKDTLKALVKHYIAAVNADYNGLLKELEKYITQKKTKLQLELYVTDNIVKATVNKFLTDQINNQKNQFRKMLFKAVNDRRSLSAISAIVIKCWHAKPHPQTLSKKRLAQVALLRLKAEPIAHKKGTRGENTGFWGAVNDALTMLYKKHGSDRRNEAWSAWETEIITDDEARYPDNGFLDDTFSGGEEGEEGEPEDNPDSS